MKLFCKQKLNSLNQNIFTTYWLWGYENITIQLVFVRQIQWVKFYFLWLFDNKLSLKFKPKYHNHRDMKLSPIDASQWDESDELLLVFV